MPAACRRTTAAEAAQLREIGVLLIGGTSHVGKSALAQALAAKLGWEHLSTDRLARHPGRPWATSYGPFPQHVASHYLSLSVEELTTAQLRHYQRLWPRIEAMVAARATDTGTGRLILEGSGVLPHRVAALKTPNTAAVWLTASAAVLKDRIYSASGFDERTAEEKVIVEKFLGRTERYGQLILSAVSSLGFASIDTSAAPSTAELIEQCLQAIG
jgi:2-phosphoglycerate kinase